MRDEFARVVERWRMEPTAPAIARDGRGVGREEQQMIRMAWMVARGSLGPVLFVWVALCLRRWRGRILPRWARPEIVVPLSWRGVRDAMARVAKRVAEAWRARGARGGSTG